MIHFENRTKIPVVLACIGKVLCWHKFTSVRNFVCLYFYRFKLWSNEIVPKGKPYIDIWDPGIEFCSYVPFSLTIKAKFNHGLLKINRL